MVCIHPKTHATLTNLTYSRYHVHFQINSQLGNLIHLVLALLVDLGLNKQPTAKVLGKASFRAFNLPWEPPVRRTLEEMRTFLGCFYITSVSVFRSSQYRVVIQAPQLAGTYFLIGPRSVRETCIPFNSTNTPMNAAEP